MTDTRDTQTSVEQWGSINPPAQVTQVALEHWATVADGVFVPPPSGANIAVMVLA